MLFVRLGNPLCARGNPGARSARRSVLIPASRIACATRKRRPTHMTTVAWRHLNPLGEYDFSAEKLRDSVGIRLP
jgi:hypothetical protein